MLSWAARNWRPKPRVLKWLMQGIDSPDRRHALDKFVGISVDLISNPT
jgi:hypothetical protein